MTDGFDSGHYTAAPLQTDGVIRFAGSPDAVFARITNHPAMTDWVPLLKTVQVSHPEPVPPGESMAGTARVLALRGGVTVREEIVYWDPPHGYAYTTEGKRWPLHDYVGFMGVQAAAGGGGDFLFREYFNVDGAVRRALVPPGIVILGRRALRNLSKLIGGTSMEFRHVPAPTSPSPDHDE
jgi:Polyketide cyclase / dehydrase and lipid transport